jgi:magnesium chelatase family protein
MSFEEAIETTKVHSISGLLPEDVSLIKVRPFRAPHHTMSTASLVGGGKIPTPGEISLANNGVLFLDELPEFPKTVTEALRQPMEDGVVTITRSRAKLTYPSSFMLLAAMNPCKCGYFGDESNRCTCTPESVRKYLDRISGPLLDRIDIEIELPAVSYADISGKNAPGEPSSAIRKRVNAAREFANKRLSEAKDTIGILNAKLTPGRIRKYCKMTPEANEVMREAFESLGFSARAHDKVLRVARTIADLDASEIIGAEHISEAIMYRALDRKYWNR